jgi:hypothetical protein
MTVSKRITQIPIGAGVDESANDYLFESPLVRAANNVQTPKVGAYAKRYGETLLSATLPDTTTYGDHRTVTEQDGRTVVVTQLGAYSHDPVKDAWTQLGNVAPRPSRALTDRLVRQNNSSAEPEIALVTLSSKTVACIAWHDVDTQEGLYMWAEVPSDGSPLRVLSGPTKFGGTRLFSYSIRLAVIGTTVYAIAGDSQATTDTYHTSCDANATYTFATPTTTAWASSSSPVALLTDGGSNLWAVISESGGGYSIRKLSTNFVQSAFVTVAGAAALDACRNGSTIAVIKGDGSLDTVADTLPGAPTNTAIVTVGASGPLYGSATRGTICVAASSSYFMAWSRPATAQAIEGFGTVLASVTSGLAVTITGVVGTVLLAGRAAYNSAEGLPILPVLDVVNTGQWRAAYVGRPATGGDGLYTLAEVCRFSTDVAIHQPSTTTAARTTSRSLTSGFVSTSHTIYPLPSPVYDTASGQWLMPHLVLNDTAAIGFDGAANIGVDLLRLSTVSAPASRAVSASDLRVLGSGCGATYLDGPVHAEMTPAPIGLYNTDQSGDPETIAYGGGTVPETNSHIILAARWRDEKGNLHRGAPLYVLTASMWDDSPVGDDVAVRVRFPRPFPATIRGDKGGQKYEVEVYMAAAAEGPYYITDVVTPRAHPSILGVDYILCSDPRGAGGGIPTGLRGAGADYVASLYDTAVIPSTAIQRWTETGELVHTPCPPVVDVCSTQSRVWLLSAEQGRQIVRPSKEIVTGYAPEFCADLDIVIPSEGGECRAIAAMNDKVVVFKDRLIYVIFGDPGDNTGANPSLQTPRLVQGDVGCSEAQSVVEGPFGVVFRSSAGGFHLLTPDLSVQQLPQLEDTLGAAKVISGMLVADRKEVRWSTLLSGSYTTLVWDYSVNAWMTHTHASGTLHAATVGGVPVRLTSGGAVYLERETWSTTLDSHSATITSAWIKTAGLQGFVRVWKVAFLLRWFSGGITITLAYDYDEGTVSTHVYSATEMSNLAAVDGRVELVCHLSRQKVESFRFTIAENNPADQNPPPRGAGFALLGATIEWGSKRGSHAHTVPAGARR